MSAEAKGADGAAKKTEFSIGGLMDAVAKLYNTSSAKEQADILQKWYAPQARFEDNFVLTRDREGMRLQFAGMIATCDVRHASKHSFSSSSGSETAVTILSTLAIRTLLLRFTVDVVTTLRVNAEGRVTYHRDVWQECVGLFKVFKRALCMTLNTALFVTGF